jgi:hypothetical protein
MLHAIHIHVYVNVGDTITVELLDDFGPVEMVQGKGWGTHH